MKVIVVSQQLKKTISGIGLHTNNLVRSLLADGHEVCVITPVDQIPTGSLPYRSIPVPPPFPRQNQARWVSLSASFGRALRRLLKNEFFDLVHFTDARESLFSPRGLPTVGNVNDTYSAELFSAAYYRRFYEDWFSRWAYYRFVHLCEQAVYPRLDAVLANSHYTAQVIAAQYALRPEKLFVCHKSIDPSLYEAALRLRLQLEPHPPRVLFVGTNMQRKGLPLLIRAAPAVRKAVPGTEFWIAGEDKVIPKMRMLCRQQGVEEAFHFLGWKSQAELVEIYAHCDVFAMPSLVEAFGVVFLEAMAAGLAVVGTSVGGVAEIIADGQTGCLVPPEDPAALGQALAALLADEPRRGVYRRAALERMGQFSVQTMMECTYRVYERLVKG